VRWETPQKDLLLILARDMASRLATPMFVVDAGGTLVFYNEAAEAVLGRTFSDAGEMHVDEWASAFSPADPDGGPLELRDLPLGIALFDGRPEHRDVRILAADETERYISITAIPLLAHQGEVVGAVALFWDRAGAGG
jgi:PAS domain-containing protein